MELTSIDILLGVLKIFSFVLPVLISVALLVYLERKVLGAVQLRRGPNVVGPFGILQSFADVIKLITKENILPSNSNKFLFIFAPILTLLLRLIAWAVIPISSKYVTAGWSSNSKYPFLGALRSAAQMISYEVSIGFVIITVLLCVGSLNLTDIVESQKNVWFVLPLFPMFIVFIISCLAETNRLPFDLPEDEATLVAGFFTEYSSISFGLFFLAEYANMILMSSLTVILFLGGWYPPIDLFPFNAIPGLVWFSLKVFLILFVFLWVRATFPRYRYDQLMRLGWKIFLPLTLIWVVLTSSFLYYFEMLPQ